MFEFIKKLKGKIMSEEQANQSEEQKPATGEAPETGAEPTATDQAAQAGEEVVPGVDGSPVVFYNGQKVVEKLEEVTGDGRLCRLADGSTAYVPLGILGE